MVGFKGLKKNNKWSLTATDGEGMSAAKRNLGIVNPIKRYIPFNAGSF